MRRIRRRTVHREALKQRIVVEHHFCHLKKFKRIKTRAERKIDFFASLVYFVSALRTFKQLTREKCNTLRKENMATFLTTTEYFS